MAVENEKKEKKPEDNSEDIINGDGAEKENKSETEKADGTGNCGNEKEEKEAEAKEPENKSRKAKKEEAAAAKQLDEMKKKFDELNDRYMRMIAEYDNYRKRAAKEKESVYADAYGDVIKEILPIMDNLERAAKFTDGEKVAEGINMTLNQFVEALKKLGIEEIDAENGFDPNLHNAVMHIEDESLGENVVTEVFQKGYKKGDKVIRHAMVKVAN